MASKLVRTPDDTKGLKLRVPGPTGNAVVEAMGATPVTMPVPDLPQALSTHAVDGALIPWEIIPALQLYETTQYQIEGPDQNALRHHDLPGLDEQGSAGRACPTISRRSSTRIPARTGCATVAEIWRASDDGGIALAVENGNEHIVLTDDEMAAFNAVLAPVVDSWIEEHSRRLRRRRRWPTRPAPRSRRGSLERRGARGGRRAAAARDAHRLRARRRRGIVRGWALLGGLLTLGARRDDRGERGLEPACPAGRFAGDYELVKHVIAIAIFMFLPYCQITGANVTVDIFTEGMSERGKAAMAAFSSLFAVAFSLLLLVQMTGGLRS